MRSQSETHSQRAPHSELRDLVERALKQNDDFAVAREVFVRLVLSDAGMLKRLAPSVLSVAFDKEASNVLSAERDEVFPPSYRKTRTQRNQQPSSRSRATDTGGGYAEIASYTSLARNWKLLGGNRLGASTPNEVAKSADKRMKVGETNLERGRFERSVAEEGLRRDPSSKRKINKLFKDAELQTLKAQAIQN